jgi:hypothetical protein
VLLHRLGHYPAGFLQTFIADFAPSLLALIRAPLFARRRCRPVLTRLRFVAAPGERAGEGEQQSRRAGKRRDLHHRPPDFDIQASV